MKLVLGLDAAREADDQVRAEVAGLLEDGGLDTSDIVISVDRGVVSLDGSVTSCGAKDAAADLVFKAAGVVGVVNKLAVVPTRESTDQTIATAIVDALERSGGPGCTLVDVEVDGGMVTLTGTVPDWPSYRAAMDAAWATPGVVALQNKLEINP